MDITPEFQYTKNMCCAFSHASSYNEGLYNGLTIGTDVGLVLGFLIGMFVSRIFINKKN